MFKNKNLFSKVFMVLCYGLILISVILVSFKSILFAIVVFFGLIMFFYIELMVLYVLMVAPEMYIFKDTIEICKRIEKIFKKGFHEYNTYLSDKEISNINHIIDKSKVPDKNILSLWKYKLSSRKGTFQITLPLVGLIILSLFNIPIKEDLVSILQNYISIDFLKEIDIRPFKWIVQVISYPYLFVVYYSNIDRIENSIAKIELLKDIL